MSEIFKKYMDKVEEIYSEEENVDCDCGKENCDCGKENCDCKSKETSDDSETDETDSNSESIKPATSSAQDTIK